MRETFIREGIGKLKPDFVALMEGQVSGLTEDAAEQASGRCAALRPHR